MARRYLLYLEIDFPALLAHLDAVLEVEQDKLRQADDEPLLED